MADIAAIEFKAGQQVTRQTTTGCQTGATVANTVTLQNRVADQTIISDLNVKAYPNPFTDKVRFTIKSPKAGRATLEVYNMLGQKVGVPFEGQHNASETCNMEYTAPVSNRTNLLHVAHERRAGKW